MNREEMVKKIEYKFEDWDEDTGAYIFSGAEEIADFVISEITAAEKRGRLEIAEKTLSMLEAMEPENVDDMFNMEKKNYRKIIAANSSHVPITSTTNNERLSSTEKLNSEVDKIISDNSSPEISLCPACNCMTHTINGKCGKCDSAKTREA